MYTKLRLRKSQRERRERKRERRRERERERQRETEREYICLYLSLPFSLFSIHFLLRALVHVGLQSSVVRVYLNGII